MIRDITLGQYYPGDSLIHRLDPRIKIITTIAYIAALFIADGFIGLATSAAVIFIVTAVSRARAQTDIFYNNIYIYHKSVYDTGRNAYIAVLGTDDH